ncbi:HoxN/HupN/NixA family nickel/cobalt transporter [Kitasatospora sp. NBC_01287]|uniref:HoxN/HupN/NixA family nickel/cobalt transporter n=1 Tax=Kitasatospora sp. NBC_01287 TaxID=2903573 RepID=UPI0022597DFE|nr:HoxN/HupN/NixA family nickel/cobalt transporter [Kitasatospora sp. NBC_01287]MCX4749832.1 HoxN/HupN/NixA family nickel/cobalt transporter [Kitasatospora sp. NBC_01287]
MSTAPAPTTTATAVAPTRWTARLTRDEWLRLAGMGGFVLALHVVGWFTLLAVIAPKHYSIGNQAFGAGLGLTAYTLGMRHAFDADHIAAIDNTTRKLMGQGKRPLSVGFWFSLGHSSIVFGLCALLAFGVRSLASSVETDDSQLHRTTNLIGTSVSGTFLLVIGLVNLGAFNGILKVFRKMRGGHFDEAELEAQLDKRGFLNRILGRTTRAVTKSWHMYPVGMLFGLGFDTATEVSLLVLAGGAAAFSLPWYALLVLPVLFAAGMSLLDTIDGSFMNFAYEWAFSKPVRKIYYNLTVTGLSVLVALVIGVIELVGLLADQYGITGGPIGWIATLNLNNVGFAIVGLFAVTWAGALAFWKFGKVEQKWSAPPADGAVPEAE